MKKYFSLFLFIFLSIYIFSKGIIIGDDLFILRTFRDKSEKDITNIVNKINENFDEVIIHMGRADISKRGNFFFYKTSKENLKLFSQMLEDRNIKLYLWFFDSFSSEEFLELYENRNTLIYKNKQFIDELGIKYEGVVVDFEWINLNNNFDNSEKYLTFLKDIKEIFFDKKIMAFTNTIDSEYENNKRGYNIEKLTKVIDGIIPMLYVVDFGLYYAEDRIHMNFSDDRIENLLDFYKKYEKVYPAFSVTSGILLVRNNSVFYIKDMKIEDIPKEIEIKKLEDSKYHTIYQLKVLDDFEVKRNDGVLEKISKGEKVFFLEVKDRIFDISNYIWNYTFFY